MTPIDWPDNFVTWSLGWNGSSPISPLTGKGPRVVSKTPTPSPEHPSTDDLVAESRRVQAELLAAVATLEAYSRVLRSAIAEGQDDPDA
jgi:hypothetical protein